eukprot:6282412-Amphidinium_carterae.1
MAEEVERTNLTTKPRDSNGNEFGYEPHSLLLQHCAEIVGDPEFMCFACAQRRPKGLLADQKRLMHLRLLQTTALNL